MKQKMKRKLKKINTRKVLITFLLVFFVFNFSFGFPFFNTAYAGVADGVLWAFNVLLYGAFELASLLLGVAGLLFDYAIEPEKIRSILQKDAIYTGWKVVRDVLNLSFILVLLFSAFSTIFQIQKYHLKNILLLLVIMALLVNFSFPVAMFIIDASNMLMYFFLNNVMPGTEHVSLSAKFSNFSNLGETLMPEKSDMEGIALVKTLLVMILLTAVLAITLLMLAFLFIIRIFILATLLIFSPVGFVAVIFPGTKKYADSWWENLFKYSFLGPILIFVLLISLLLMQEMMTGDMASTLNQIKEGANNYAAGEENADLISGVAYFFLPIVLLWIGITSALQGAGGAGSMAINMGNKMKGWGQRLPGKIAGGTWRATGIPGTYKKTMDTYKKEGFPGRLKKVPGLGGTDARERREDSWSAKLTGKREKYEKDQVLEKNKKYKERGSFGDEEAKKDLESGDRIKKMAAAMHLARQGQLENLDQYEEAAETMEQSPQLKEVFDKDVKKKQVKLLIEKKIKDDKINKKDAGKMSAVYNDYLKEMNAEDLAKQKDLLTEEDFHKFFMEEKVTNPNTGDESFAADIAKKASSEIRQNLRNRGYGI